MSKFQTALLLGVLVGGPAFAQSTSSTTTATVPPMSVPSVTVPAPAVNAPNPSNSPPQALSIAPDAKTPGAPVPGANSFTEAQARSRVESRGYTNVSSLMKDEQSIWRGKASKDGKDVSIAVDYQGNVVAQ
jgi:putative membrane protein